MQIPSFLRQGLARWFAILALLVIGGVGGGCAKASEQELTQTIERTVEIDPNGTLTVENPNGAVRIYGSTASEIKLTAIKRARTAARLDEIKIEVSEGPLAVTIDTKLPALKGRSSIDPAARVDYTLVVPQSVKLARLDVENGDVVIVGMRGEGVRATIVNGQLTTQNCFSDTHLSVGNGALNVSYDWWEEKMFSVHGQIMEGDASASIPQGASFHVAAQTAKGKVINDFSETVEIGGRSRQIDRFVGTGVSPEIRLRATNGDIKIASPAVTDPKPGLLTTDKMRSATAVR